MQYEEKLELSYMKITRFAVTLEKGERSRLLGQLDANIRHQTTLTSTLGWLVNDIAACAISKSSARRCGM